MEYYPDKQRFLKFIIGGVCLIVILQTIVLIMVLGRMDFFEFHFYDQHKRIMNIENRFGIQGE